MKKRLLILEGPGLESSTRANAIAAAGRELDVDVDHRQTDDPDRFFDSIRSAGDYGGLLVNPIESAQGANFEPIDFRTALDSLDAAIPAIELRLDNVFVDDNTGPEPVSIPGLSVGFVAGLGDDGYRLAMRALCGAAAAGVPDGAQTGEARSILVLNGPNLNLLGSRQPDVYGHDTLDDIARRSLQLANPAGVSVEFRQSNHEGELVDWIQGAIGARDALVINAAAYTHTSVALHDALLAYDGFKVELHISNPHARDAFRHHSFVSSAVDAVIAGLGPAGYELVTGLLVERFASR